MIQKIRIRGTDEEFSVQEQIYPFIENGILYLRLIVVDHEKEPIQFLTVTPYDIIYRVADYDEEIMNEINTASDKAHLEQAVRMATQEDIDNTVVDDDRYYG